MSAPGQFGGGFQQDFNQMNQGFNNMSFQPAAAEVPAEPMKLEPMKLDLGKAAFNVGGGEFIPKGKMVATKDQFPDLDALDNDSKPKKGAKKGKKKATVVSSAAAIEEEQIDMTSPWKGKKSSFFEMKVSETPLNDPMNPSNFDMNQEQWNFIFKFYPEFGAAPYDMMIWLYGQAKMSE